jgi:hypothetical protein
MNWHLILKRTVNLDDTQLRDKIPDFQTAQEKGYPSILNNLTFVTDLTENDEVISYTTFKDMGKFYFVGNNYTVPKFRGRDTWKKIINARNSQLNKPKITLLNPKEGVDIKRLATTVENLGGKKIESYSEVEDIMDEQTFNELNVLPMYRYGE